HAELDRLLRPDLHRVGRRRDGPAARRGRGHHVPAPVRLRPAPGRLRRRLQLQQRLARSLPLDRYLSPDRNTCLGDKYLLGSCLEAALLRFLRGDRRMSATLVVRHKVDDYAAWKVYDEL